MKIRHLLIGLFAFAAIVACDQELVETPSLEVSQESLELAAKAGEASFDVTANLAWIATADQDWVNLEPASGDASKDAVKVTVTADDNATNEARTATVTVKAGDLTKTVALTQAAAEAEDPGDDPGDEPVVPEVTELYMLGAACDTGWGLDQMTAFQLVEGVWVWEGNLKVDDFRFPLQKQSNVWWPCLVPTTEGKVAYATDDNQVENPYRVESEGYYKVTVNVEEMTVTFERLSDRVEPSLVVTELYLLGDAVDTGWSLADMPAFENNNGVFTWTGHLKANSRWRFPLQKVENGWWPCLVLSADGTTLSLGQGDADDTSYLLPQSGIYTLTFNLANWDNRSFTIELVEADPETEASYTVAGTISGCEWNPAGEAGLMTKEGDYYVAKNVPFLWRSTLYTDSPGQDFFQLKVCETGSWTAYCKPQDGIVDHANVAIEVSIAGSNIDVHAPEGTYDVYLDKANSKVWVMKAGYKPGDEVPEDEPEPVDPSTIELYMLGSGCSTGWSLDDMTKFENNNGILSWTGYLKPEEFRLPLQKQPNVWWPCYMISPDGQSLVLGRNDADKVVYTVDYPATYTITINATDVNNPTFTIEAVETALSLVGTLAGDNNGWNNTSEAGKMTWDGEYFVLQNAPLVWRSSIWGADEDYFDFKVCALGTWDAFGAVSAGPHAANAAIDLTWGGTEIDVVAPEGNYDVYFDPAKRQIWFMTPGYKPGDNAPEVEQPGEPEAPMFEVNELYMLGGACDTGWGLDEMTSFENVDGVWVWEGNLKPGGDNEQFRFPLQKVSNQWWPCLVPNADGTAVILGTADGVANTYRVPSEGYYKVTVNPMNGAMTVERLGDRVEVTVEVTELYMLGGACDTGWDLGAMTAFENNNGVFTWTGNLKAGEKFRFPVRKVENGWWPCLMISADGTQLVYGQGDADEVIYTVAEDGEYTITIDVTDWHNRTVSIVKVEKPVEPAASTIASVLALGKDATVPADTFVEGVVISNLDINNLTSKKGMYIQDETAGLQFYLAANHTFKFGDKVKVDLSGAKIGAYNGAIQISGLALAKIELLSSGNVVEPKTVTIADFLANKYEGQYVAIENVQVAKADLSKTFVMGGAHTSIKIEDADGKNFVVFSSKYATYGTTAVPQGSGTLKGISSINNGNMQLIFAQTSDFAGLTGERFGEEVVEPENPETPVATNRADFETLTRTASYVANTTEAGWVLTNCAVQEGHTSDINPQYILIGKIEGTDTWAKAACMNGKTSAAGSIESPELAGGCGTLEFDFAHIFSDKNGMDFNIDVIQNNEVVKTIHVTRTATEAAKMTKLHFSEEVNVSGTFKLKFTNNCPTKKDGNADRVSIWNLTWTSFE